MSLFKNIIIALDFKTEDEKAKIDHAIAIAKMDETVTFTLVNIVPKINFDPEKDIMPAEKREGISQKKALEQLETIAEKFPNSDKVSCLTRVGTPSTEIVKQVLTAQHDLLLTSTRQQITVKEHLLGNTMIELMRQCPCPVWAIKPGTSNVGKLMVGVHFDDEVADHNDTLNHRLLNIAVCIAETTNKKIHLVNVVKQKDEELSAERVTQLKSLADDIPSTSAEMIPVVVTGDIESTISGYATEQSVDILIMGMLSRTGLKGFFIGNTAEKIMDNVDCSLIVVKPKEFVSQISL